MRKRNETREHVSHTRPHTETYAKRETRERGVERERERERERENENLYVAAGTI